MGNIQSQNGGADGETEEALGNEGSEEGEKGGNDGQQSQLTNDLILSHLNGHSDIHQNQYIQHTEPYQSQNDDNNSEDNEENCFEQEIAEKDPTGRYERFDIILGKGAAKTVYKGFDTYNGQEIAWNQVFICDTQYNDNERHRIFNEVNLLSKLKHAHVLSLYSTWYDPKHKCINFITEVFTSGTLRQYRNKHKRISCQVMKKWAYQILQGLVYLHGHTPPIIHRDLKCDNIFYNGSTGQLKIGDLGLATIFTKSCAHFSVLGTPEFMAPELYNQQYDEKVDVYSFGMCLLEVATLQYPYNDCNNPMQIFKRVMEGQLPNELNLVKDDELRNFIRLCIQHDPRQRPHAKELVKHPIFQDITNKPYYYSNLSQKDIFSDNSTVSNIDKISHNSSFDSVYQSSMLSRASTPNLHSQLTSKDNTQSLAGKNLEDQNRENLNSNSFSFGHGLSMQHGESNPKEIPSYDPFAKTGSFQNSWGKDPKGSQFLNGQVHTSLDESRTPNKMAPSSLLEASSIGTYFKGADSVFQDDSRAKLEAGSSNDTSRGDGWPYTDAHSGENVVPSSRKEGSDTCKSKGSSGADKDQYLDVNEGPYSNIQNMGNYFSQSQPAFSHLDKNSTPSIRSIIKSKSSLEPEDLPMAEGRHSMSDDGFQDLKRCQSAQSKNVYKKRYNPRSQNPIFQQLAPDGQSGLVAIKSSKTGLQLSFLMNSQQSQTENNSFGPIQEEKSLGSQRISPKDSAKSTLKSNSQNQQQDDDTTNGQPSGDLGNRQQKEGQEQYQIYKGNNGGEIDPLAFPVSGENKQQFIDSGNLTFKVKCEKFEESLNCKIKYINPDSGKCNSVSFNIDIAKDTIEEIEKELMQELEFSEIDAQQIINNIREQIRMVDGMITDKGVVCFETMPLNNNTTQVDVQLNDKIVSHLARNMSHSKDDPNRGPPPDNHRASSNGYHNTPYHSAGPSSQNNAGLTSQSSSINDLNSNSNDDNYRSVSNADISNTSIYNEDKGSGDGSGEQKMDPGGKGGPFPSSGNVGKIPPYRGDLYKLLDKDQIKILELDRALLKKINQGQQEDQALQGNQDQPSRRPSKKFEEFVQKERQQSWYLKNKDRNNSQEDSYGFAKQFFKSNRGSGKSSANNSFDRSRTRYSTDSQLDNLNQKGKDVYDRSRSRYSTDSNLDNLKLKDKDVYDDNSQTGRVLVQQRTPDNIFKQRNKSIELNDVSQSKTHISHSTSDLQTIDHIQKLSQSANSGVDQVSRSWNGKRSLTDINEGRGHNSCTLQNKIVFFYLDSANKLDRSPPLVRNDVVGSSI